MKKEMREHHMVAKCGESKLWHGALHEKKPCYPWKEGETEWHRALSGQT